MLKIDMRGAITCLLVVCFAAQPVHADSDEPAVAAEAEVAKPKTGKDWRARRLRWNYRRVHWAEPATAAGLMTLAIVVNQAKTPSRWTRTNGFDSAIRDAIQVGGKSGERFRLASDIGEFTLLGFPFLVDALGIALIGDRNTDVMLQMASIQFQSFAFNGFLTTLTKTIAGRVRPEAEALECGTSSVPCSSSVNRSFFSGHTSYAFTGAGLVCVEQRHLNLFGRVGGPIACGTALAFASLTGAFRVVGDRHWATDVLVGAGVGLFSGWMLPWLMHYRHKTDSDVTKKKTVRGSVIPFAQDDKFGLGYGGIF